MSQPDYINDLPAELLFFVFDYLDLKQQLTAKLVCSRWLKVLKNERYLARCRILLNPNKMTSELCYECLKDKVAFRIEDTFSPLSVEAVQRIRRLFLDYGVSKHVLELEFTLVTWSWMDFFVQNNLVELPKLRKIKLFCGPVECFNADKNPYQLVLPNLKAIALQVASFELKFLLLEQCSKQIESLDLTPMLYFPPIFKTYPFTKLRSLTIQQQCAGLFNRPDFSPAEVDTFSRIRELRFVGTDNAIIPGYDAIVRAATHLEKLIVNGRVMNSLDEVLKDGANSDYEQLWQALSEL